MNIFIRKLNDVINRLLKCSEKHRYTVRIISDVLSYQIRRKISIITRTWNPVTGCTHMCKYCWARRLAETRLRHVKRYRHGFKPRLNVEEFSKKFEPGEFIFVSDKSNNSMLGKSIVNSRINVNVYYTYTC